MFAIYGMIRGMHSLPCVKTTPIYAKIKSFPGKLFQICFTWRLI